MKKAFTLAEVLITMGVIGVVAALTIPSLSANYQKRVLTTQLQKAYAEISQAGAMVIADEMTDDFRTSRAIRNRRFIGPYLKSGGTSSFASNYEMHDNRGTNYNIWGEMRGNYNCGSLSSGAVVCVDEHARGILDVNGQKGPNVIGRDAFSIGFLKNGTISYDYSPSLESIMLNDWDIDRPNDW